MSKKGLLDTDPKLLAVKFLQGLLGDESTEWFEAMRSRQFLAEKQGHTDTCASHDVCDSNMVMDEAFQSTFKREPDTNGPDCDLWNEAWGLAVDIYTFKFKKIQPLTEDDFECPKCGRYFNGDEKDERVVPGIVRGVRLITCRKCRGQFIRLETFVPTPARLGAYILEVLEASRDEQDFQLVHLAEDLLEAKEEKRTHYHGPFSATRLGLPSPECKACGGYMTLQPQARDDFEEWECEDCSDDEAEEDYDEEDEDEA